MAVPTTVPVHRLSVEAVLAMVRAEILDGGYRAAVEHREGGLAPGIPGVAPIALDRLFRR